MPAPGLWRSAARTHPGKVRGSNEDALLDRSEQGLWAVADGMGGHHGGERASQLIVESLAGLPTQGGFDARLQRLRQCLHWINRRLTQELTVVRGEPAPIIGSTVVALLVEGCRAACVWAGDSRCYLWRGQRLFQLTRDHSLRQQLIDRQGMSIEQASGHPSAHALTQAIGASEALTLDILELRLLPGDAFLLCSDGLYQGVSERYLPEALGLTSPDGALDRLFEQVLRGPARDNLTAVVIRQ